MGSLVRVASFLQKDSPVFADIPNAVTRGCHVEVPKVCSPRRRAKGQTICGLALSKWEKPRRNKTIYAPVS
jgi:hypothetical protein